MTPLLISPHNDDEALFASSIMLRYKPVIMIMTDGVIHEQRFGKERGVEIRQNESIQACEIAKCDCIFGRIPDDNVTVEELEYTLRELASGTRIFAPAKQGGHKHHDLISEVYTKMFPGQIIYYSTYTKENLSPQGEIPLFLTDKEKKLKTEMLACYKSQHSINQPHFDAVKDVPEFINLNMVPNA